jgi:hypothetical protein
MNGSEPFRFDAAPALGQENMRLRPFSYTVQRAADDFIFNVL